MNQAAPVKSSGEIEIGASVSEVWRVLTEIDDWPAWQEDVTESRLLDRLQEGAEFRWKAGGIPLRSRVHTMIEHREFGWTGKSLGTSAVHNWWFSESGGGTLVRVEESLHGILPRLLRSSFQRTLDAGIRKNLRELGAAAESAG